MGKKSINLWARLICFLDVETTGLSVFLGHEVIQIGAVLIEPRVLERLGEFERKIILARPEKENPQSRDFNHYDPAIWESEAVPPEQALREFGEFAREAIIFGQNISFDAGFIGELAVRVGVSLQDYGVDYHYFDLATLSYAILAPFGLMQGLNGVSLSKVAKFLGLPEYKEHDALADARVSADIYAILISRLRGEWR